MDVLKRNTDYALRAMAFLAKNYGGDPVSTRLIAEKEEISYQLACKLMQKLHDAGLVSSKMGPKGGFALTRKPDEIDLLTVIKAVQGPISVNRCQQIDGGCPRHIFCPLTGAIDGLQKNINEYLSSATLGGLLKGK